MTKKTLQIIGIIGVVVIIGYLIFLGVKQVLGASATFGYSVVGSSWQGVGEADRMQCMPATSIAGSYQLDSIGAYMKTGSGAYHIKGVLVLASTKTIVANGVGNVVDIVSGTGAWVTSTFTTPPVLTASTVYHLCIVQDGGAAFSYAYDAGDWASGELFDETNSYASPTDPTDGVIDSFGAYFSIYGTYSDYSAPSGSDYNPSQNSVIIVQ